MKLTDIGQAYKELSKLTTPKKRSLKSVKICLDKENSKKDMYMQARIEFSLLVGMPNAICKE